MFGYIRAQLQTECKSEAWLISILIYSKSPEQNLNQPQIRPGSAELELRALVEAVMETPVTAL